MAGALDPRLTATATPSRVVLDEVLSEHDCTRPECPACGHRTSRRQPVCRSAAVAAGLRFGRRPSWSEPVTPRIPAAPPVEQPALFELDGPALRRSA